jgi:hypothetical protein
MGEGGESIGMGSRLTCGEGIICGEGIYPRWAAKRPSAFFRHTPETGLATASPPDGDKSPRHRGRDQPKDIDPPPHDA